MATQGRREQDRARRKQDILLAARAVFAENGFRRATVEQVAQRAEIAKGTIYLYFENKEAILAELVLCALSDLRTELQGASDGISVFHPEQKLHAMADAYLAFARRSPDYFRLLTAFDGGDFESGLSPLRGEQMYSESSGTLELVAQAIADGIALGTFVPTDARQAAGVIWAALNGALALMAHPVRRRLVATDLDGLYHSTLDLCLNGLMRPLPNERSTP